jgi:hypothetical protein
VLFDPGQEGGTAKKNQSQEKKSKIRRVCNPSLLKMLVMVSMTRSFINFTQLHTFSFTLSMGQ